MKIPTVGDRTVRQQKAKEAFQVVFVIAGLLVLSAALTLRTVAHPGVLEIASENPTPFGYTWSLLLFTVPITALSWWFARRTDLRFP